MTSRAKKELPDPREALAMRERQSATALVISEHFGPLTQSHPELWAHRTFLLMVGKVYEHLVLCKKISPKEFVDLTRTLVESCKADAKGRGTTAQPRTHGSVVDGLEQMVRKIYGTILQGNEAILPPPAPAITQADSEPGSVCDDVRPEP